MSEITDTTEDLDPLDIEEREAMARITAKYGLDGNDGGGSGAGPDDADSPADETLTDSTSGSADSRESQNPEAKRLADTQRAYHESRAEAAALRDRLAQQEAEIAQLRQLAEQRQSQPSSAQEELPDLDSALEDFDIAPVVKHVKADKQRLDRIEQAIINQQRTDAQRQALSEQERHNQAILSRHPDATALTADQRFIDWVQRQPPALRQIVAQGDADSVNWLLDSFKQAANTGLSRNASNRAASVPNLRGMSPAMRQPDTATGKVPLSSLKGMSSGDIATLYPDDSVIDYAA